MNIILDILAVAILALSIFFGHKKGFVKTVLNLCGGIICLIVAIVLSPTVGDFISTNYVTPTVENVVTEKMSALATVGDTNEPDVDKIVRDEPNEFIKLLERLNIDTEAFAEKFEEFKQSSAENTAELTVEYIAKPLSGAISYVIAFILLLIVSSLIIAILGFLLDKIVKLPILRTANKFLGVVSGAILGLIWVYVISMIVEIALPYITTSSSPIVSGLDPHSTLLFRYFYSYNPVYEIIKALF